ncbi:MAG: dihydropteroate synthase, partial [Lachnospiraceae bacterium]|nr:dihydropteroate synthase [Lachnospiraceae bacterium]
TMNDIYEAKAAILAAKETCELPVFLTTAYDASGKLLTGADAKAVVAVAEGLGVDALGINCSLGPEQMMGIVEELAEYASVPVIVNPNAGIPRTENGKTVYDVTPDKFREAMIRIAGLGGRILGGCCGTTPQHISSMIAAVKEMPPLPLTWKEHTLIASYTHAVEFSGKPILIGERINPTGKSKFKQALRDHNMDYILQEGLTQQEKQADVLDVNVGLPEIDEAAMMTEVVMELQGVTDLPLQIDTTDSKAMEQALRRYNGKAMINSVNGKEEVMREVFPLVRKYGGLVVALTIDEDGIPETAEGRLAIVDKIYKKAAEYGIAKKDIIIDPLAMSVSADKESAKVTLDSLKGIKERYQGRTSLGVSNISFGLPNRDFINASFFTMAMQNGLDAAIMNPNSLEMMKAYHTFCALQGYDENFADYIEYASNLPAVTVGNGAGGAGMGSVTAGSRTG